MIRVRLLKKTSTWSNSFVMLSYKRELYLRTVLDLILGQKCPFIDDKEKLKKSKNFSFILNVYDFTFSLVSKYLKI